MCTGIIFKTLRGAIETLNLGRPLAPPILLLPLRLVLILAEYGSTCTAANPDTPLLLQHSAPGVDRVNFSLHPFNESEVQFDEISRNRHTTHARVFAWP